MTTTPHHCPVCFAEVDTYRPTGTRGVLRAERHGPVGHRSEGGPPACAGSFGPVTTAAAVQLDRERTASWHASTPAMDHGHPFAAILSGQRPVIRQPKHDGGPSLREYLESRGER